MADGLNRATLLGNLGGDPELRSTQSGMSILKLSLATTTSYLDAQKVRQERTEWHKISVFGKRAEGLHKILSKGDRIYVEGEIRTSSYEKDGEKRWSTEIAASDVKLCGGGKSNGGDRGGERRSSGGGGGQRSGGAPPDDGFGGGPGGGFGGDDDIPF